MNLSNFYPSDTSIGHIYPVNDPLFPYRPAREKNPLYAGRLVGISGPDTNIFVFPETEEGIQILDELGFPQTDRRIVIQQNTTRGLILAAQEHCKKRRVVLAQRPLTDAEALKEYMLHDVTTLDYLQDKGNLKDLIDPKLMPEILYSFEDGNALYDQEFTIEELPFVIKSTHNAAGNGVHICKTLEDVQKAKDSLRHNIENLFIEKFIEGDPVSILYGITPAGEIIEISDNMQISEGSCNQGGIVHANVQIPLEVRKLLRESILMKMRDMGYCGTCSIGGIKGKDGKYRFFDPNIRPSASLNSGMHRGRYSGKSQATFFSTLRAPDATRLTRALATIAQPQKAQLLHLTSIARASGDESLWMLHGAVLCDDNETLRENALETRNALEAFEIKSYALGLYETSAFSLAR